MPGSDRGDVKNAVDLNDVVQKAVGLVSSLIKKATFDFQARYADNLPTFKGNGQRIEQVVINLLVNACQAMEDRHKPLRIATGYSQRSAALFVEVRDTGMGMPPEILQRITDPFFTTKRDSGGTGLGLSISDTIIREHGGRLDFDTLAGQGHHGHSLDSMPPNGGTEKGDNMTKAPDLEQPIVVIDDEVPILLAVDTTLQMAGMKHVITCSDSRQAMGLLHRTAPAWSCST